MMDMNYIVFAAIVVLLLYILPLLFKLALVVLVVAIGFAIWSGYGDVIVTYLRSVFKPAAGRNPGESDDS